MSNLDNEYIVHIPEDESFYPTRSIAEYFLETLNNHKDKICQIDAATGQEETFDKFLSRCLCAAQALETRGIQFGDVISYCCFNNMDYKVTMIASIFVGAKFSPLDPSTNLENIINCLNIIQPRIMFCDAENEYLVESAVTKANLNIDIIVYGKSINHITFSNFISNIDETEEYKINKKSTIQDTVCLCFTSGTSGTIKAAQITQLAMYFDLMALQRCIPNVNSDLYLSLPYWISNIMFSCASLLSGRTNIIYKYFDKDVIGNILEKYKVELILLTQNMITQLVQHSKNFQYNMSAMKYILFGGSKVGKNQILKLTKLFPHSILAHGYGMTELGGMGFYFKEYEYGKLLQIEQFSIGTPIPGIYYKIVDLETEKCLGPNRKGELRIKSKILTNGYYKEPVLTKNAFDHEGYLKTGDISYYDNEKNFYIVDRLKEIFKYKGWHISPTIIEDVLLKHPDVENAAVVGIPHDSDGELVTALLILRKNAITEINDILNFAHERLSDMYHIRGGVYIVDHIPVTSSGKLRRNYMRDLIINKLIC